MLDETDPKTGKQLIRIKDPSLVLDELEAVLEELGDKQALIFSESRQLMELAHARVTRQADGKRSYGMGLITGAISDDDRDRARHAFNGGHMQHLGLTMGAGGEGLTLTAASAMIFIERSFSLKKNVQAEGRAVRPGQDERVLVIDIVPYLTDRKGRHIPTIYEHVLNTVVTKKENAEEILRDQQTIKKFLEGAR
jgi:SNF2 family DNA or RNA helicase